MAQAIGTVKSVEKGTFYVKDPKGYMHQIRVGDTIQEGDLIFGSPINMADAKVVIDVLLPGTGDLVISQNGALTFDSSVLAGMFNGQDTVATINPSKESFVVADTGTESNVDAAAGEVTEAGDETAAGEEVTNTEYVGDVFSSPNGMITDVTTDLRPTAASINNVTVETAEVLPVQEEAPETPPPPPVGEQEINIPVLDVSLGEVEIQMDTTPAGEMSIQYSAIGGGHSYLADDKLIIDEDGNIPSVGDATVHYNPGNGYGVTSLNEKDEDESKDHVKMIDTTDGEPEALVLDMNDNLVSVDIEIKHPKQEVHQENEGVRWEAYDSNGNLVGSDTLYFDDNDSVHSVTITSNEVENGSFQYVVFVGTGDGYYVGDVSEGMAVDYTYSYPLDIIDASLTGESVGILGDIVVTGLEPGSVLTHESYDPIIVPESGTVTFGSDTDPTSWTLTVDNELSDESIVASLNSIGSDGSSATAFVGVFGDNEIVGTNGDDSFDGRDGMDTMYGLDGDDSFVYDTSDALVDGGAGTDTLILTGSTSIDFNNWDSSSIKNIEVIDLTEGDNSLSNIAYDDVVSMTNGNNSLYILGNSGDVVDFLDNGNWQVGTDTVIQNVNGIDHVFDVYSHTEDPTVIVHVEQAITDTIL